MSKEKEGARLPEASKHDRLVVRENQARALWAQEGVKEAQLAPRDKRPNFVFYEGPPTANGRPGVHHLFNRTLKDTLLRWQWFLGYNVRRTATWDTHGLPVELEVERALGLTGKVSVEKMGEFALKCQESVDFYQKCWEETSTKLGYWLDWDNPARSDRRAYVQSVWWVLGRLWEQGRLEEQYRVGPWCPKCQTSLASHEVAQGMKEVEVGGLVGRVDLKEPNGEAMTVEQVAVEVWFWTTTPWTMPANAAMAVASQGEYVVVLDSARHKGVLVAKNLVAKLGLDTWTVLRNYTGEELTKYTYPSFPGVEQKKMGAKNRRVVATDWVSTLSGTGVVHLAPLYGANDYQKGQEENLELVELLDEQGLMLGAQVKGLNTTEASEWVVKDFKSKGLVVKEAQEKMERAHCWRCQSLLVDRAQKGWFVKVKDLAPNMQLANQGVAWRPETTGSGRFGSWLENTRDWSVGRTRTWGTPLPLWRCDCCGEVECVSTVRELWAKGVEVGEGDLALHRPAVDAYQWACEQAGCGGTKRRVQEVVDTWFDSGCLPWAQAWFSEAGAAKNLLANWPADLVVEGVDQTRGWFYALLAVATCLEPEASQAPYRQVVVHELVLDKTGKKMAKSLGNGVDGEKLLNEVSTDQLRVSLLAGTDVGVPRLFNQDVVAKNEAAALQTLVEVVEGVWMPWNRSQAGGGEWARESRLDSWLLARLATVGQEVMRAMSERNTTRMVDKLAKFTVEDLSQWYVRLSRRHLLEDPKSAEAEASGRALTQVLRGVVALWASVAPHLMESLGRELGLGSVHLLEGEENWAWWQVVSGRNVSNDELESWMEEVREVVRLGRVARQKAKLPVKQPLALLSVSEERWQKLGEAGRELVAAELAVKEVSQGPGPDLEVKPVWPVLGELFKGQAQEVAHELMELGARQKKELAQAEEWVTKMGTVPSRGWKVVYQDREQWVVAGDKEWVMLDSRLTEELVLDGRVRELSRAVQQARKEAKVLREDEVKVQVWAPVDWQEAFATPEWVRRGKVKQWRWVESTLGLEVRVVKEGQQQ